MFQYEWRVSFFDGKQSFRLSGRGIWFGDQILPWDHLRSVGFERFHARGGVNEILTLMFADETRRELRWFGRGSQRGEWRAMLVAFAKEGARQRPEMEVDDGPDAQAQKTARWIGLGVAGAGLAIMGVIFANAPPWQGWLVGGWLGTVTTVIGAIIYGQYARREPPPKITWEAFAQREAQPGALPIN